MLATDEKKLRWLGIDLRARWRRRVAVVANYAVLLMSLIVGWGEVVTDPGLSAHPLLALLGMAVLTLILLSISVFWNGRLVKNFDDPPKVEFQKYQIVGSLDEWAHYRYGVANFDAANKEQQTELLSKYRVGNFRVPTKPLPAGPLEEFLLDERERAERDSISRWALNRMTFFLAVFAGSTANLKHSEPMEISFYLWLFCVLGLTLPQARVLWTETDPRKAGDLRLVEGKM
jgi:hypothetical protein